MTSESFTLQGKHIRLEPLEHRHLDGLVAAAGDDAALFYEKLGSAVLPLYYGQTESWRWMMKQAIGSIAYYFNSQRMMRRYATEAYLRHTIT